MSKPENMEGAYQERGALEERLRGLNATAEELTREVSEKYHINVAEENIAAWGYAKALNILLHSKEGGVIDHELEEGIKEIMKEVDETEEALNKQ